MAKVYQAAGGAPPGAEGAGFPGGFPGAGGAGFPGGPQAPQGQGPQVDEVD